MEGRVVVEVKVNEGSNNTEQLYASPNVVQAASSVARMSQCV